MLIAATNQQPRAPNREQACPNVAPKNALTHPRAIFRGNSVRRQADRCSSELPDEAHDCSRRGTTSDTGCSRAGARLRDQRNRCAITLFWPRASVFSKIRRQ